MTPMTEMMTLPPMTQMTLNRKIRAPDLLLPPKAMLAPAQGASGLQMVHKLFVRIEAWQ
jgi:hypothetical protein